MYVVDNKKSMSLQYGNVNKNSFLSREYSFLKRLRVINHFRPYSQILCHKAFLHNNLPYRSKRKGIDIAFTINTLKNAVIYIKERSDFILIDWETVEFIDWIHLHLL